MDTLLLGFNDLMVAAYQANATRKGQVCVASAYGFTPQIISLGRLERHRGVALESPPGVNSDATQDYLKYIKSSLNFFCNYLHSCINICNEVLLLEVYSAKSKVNSNLYRSGRTCEP